MKYNIVWFDLSELLVKIYFVIRVYGKKVIGLEMWLLLIFSECGSILFLMVYFVVVGILCDIFNK